MKISTNATRVLRDLDDFADSVLNTAAPRALNKPRAKRTELPIHELYSFAPGDAFSNPDVVDAMNDRVAKQMQKVVAQEIRFAAKG